MKTNYDRISKEYQLSKRQPWRKYVEAYSFFQMTGDVSNLNILDLACGDGFYTRQLKFRGAKTVEGVDISQGMIQLAQESEAQNPLGIVYHIQDVLHLKLNKKFDLITASYLLNYAPNFETLHQFAKVIAEHLKPGGRFITINNNPLYNAPVNTLRHYGFTRENLSRVEGEKTIYTFYNEDGTCFEIINYHLEINTYELALKQAGFSNIIWHPIELAPNIEENFDTDYWKCILETQPVIGLTCTLNVAH